LEEKSWQFSVSSHIPDSKNGGFMKNLYLLIVGLFLVNGALAQWTWQNPLPQGNRLSSIQFTDLSTGYAAGDAGTVVKTINGGTDWTVLSTGTIYNLSSVCFIDANTGYAAGKGGTILKTTNGVMDWTALPSGIDNNLNSVFFIDIDTGYAVGDGGTILKTTDGGTDWSVLSSGTNNGFSSVYFTNGNTGFAVGDYGTILKTTNGGGFPVGITESTKNDLRITNYPNPVTTSTVFFYTLEEPGQVRIEIFDNFGRWVTGLVDTHQQKGDHQVTLNAGSFPAGIYYYRLQAGKKTGGGKLIKW